MTNPADTMPSGVNLASWFTDHWVRAGIVAAALLLLVAPALAGSLPWTLVLVYLQLPIYMIHQYEEHADGAFQRYVTERLGRGRMLLSARDILWINVGLVWATDAALLLLAAFVHPVWGMVAVALPVVNGALHTVFGLVDRAYNPGLWTSLALFLPVGLGSLVALGRAVGAGPATYLLVLLAGALLHAPIALFARNQSRNARP